MDEVKKTTGRPRKIKTPKKMWELWEEYKSYCDNRVIKKTAFCNKMGIFVTEEIPACVTYTLKGFCIYVNIAYQKISETYDKDPAFRDVLTRMREECEVDAREKFEFGAIPDRLAPLWMAKYGYSTKEEQEVKESVTIVDSIPMVDEKPEPLPPPPECDES